MSIVRRARGRVRSERAASGRLRAGLGLLALAAGAAGCRGSEPERLSCDDVSPAASVDFRELERLVLRDSEKGCAGGDCHGGDAQSEGLRLDTPKLIYEELSTRPEVIYPMLASGEMPEGGTPWSEADLKLLRSWYCAGAFPP